MERPKTPSRANGWIFPVPRRRPAADRLPEGVYGESTKDVLREDKVRARISQFYNATSPERRSSGITRYVVAPNATRHGVYKAESGAPDHGVQQEDSV